VVTSVLLDEILGEEIASLRYERLTILQALHEKIEKRIAFERARAMGEMHAMGFSYGELAKQFKLSRSRIQQFIAMSTSGDGPPLLEHAAAIADVVRAEFQAELLNAFRDGDEELAAAYGLVLAKAARTHIEASRAVRLAREAFVRAMMESNEEES
jgi:hypothetical protein